MPWCQTDGSFNPMQCYGSYCYCVNEKGNQMPGTKISVSVGRPVCTYTSGTVTSCQRKYREAPFQGGLVPRCKLDGQYEEVQCQGSTGECWCVDQDGKELPGNRTTEPVKCPILGADLSKCQQRYLDYARNPLPGQMIPRCREDGSFEPVQCQGLDCLCVDEDGNQIKGTSLPVRLGKPKCGISGEDPLSTCQKLHKESLQLPATPFRFIPTCKRDGRFEEIQCLRATGECWCVGKSGKETKATRTTGYLNCPSAAVSLTPCQKEYQERLSSWLLPGPYIPQCTYKGTYEPIQCQGFYCYCVNEHGVELVDSRVDITEGQPKCSAAGYTLTLCQKEFQDYLRHPLPGRFEPRCSKTGAFQEIQCHESSCFCVNREGLSNRVRHKIWRWVSQYAPDLDQCQKQLQEAINLPPNPERFVPQCKFDGSYEEIQCQNSTGLCWCVDLDGNKLSSTATNETVTCPTIDAKSLCWTRFQQSIRSASAGSHVPWCRPDGNFSPLQVQASQFFCINDRGDEVAGTSVDVSPGKPDCRAASKCYNNHV
ncbi:hypothetical protein OS493_004687 [Desmophyllum pertusum]|uniref:Thyroglobulin type-1 domain-containing protein n=1 Tax=Desmophyllum pertusum TaxID=174260 RepID=A0A9X0D173_9CNID|nr:hypothetical protein OS493_004687 [Desmophyllum pertusum]